MNYIGSNEDDGETTSPFEHATYVSFERVDASEVTATVERDALSGDVDPDALRASSSMVAAVRTEKTEHSETELDSDDLVLEIASLTAAPPSSAPRGRLSSVPPPLPSRASRASLPATVRTPSLPPTLRAPEPPPSPPVPPAPVAQAAPIPLPPPVFSAPSGPQIVPAPPMATAASTSPRMPHAPFPPAFPPPQSPPSSNGPFLFNETPSMSPVAMSLSLGAATYDAVGRPRGVRLSRAALAGLGVLVGASALTFGVVASGRLSRGTIAAAPERADTPPSEPAAAAATSPMEAEPAAVSSMPTIQPGALPSVQPAAPSVAVDTLPKVVTDPTMTTLLTSAAAKGHRVFVDGRVVGNTGSALKTKCGEHRVKVGSAGKVQVLDLPCGGELTID